MLAGIMQEDKILLSFTGRKDYHRSGVRPITDPPFHSLCYWTWQVATSLKEVHRARITLCAWSFGLIDSLAPTVEGLCKCYSLKTPGNFSLRCLLKRGLVRNLETTPIESCKQDEGGQDVVSDLVWPPRVYALLLNKKIANEMIEVVFWKLSPVISYLL